MQEQEESTDIIECILSGQERRVIELIEQGKAYVNACTSDGVTPLMICASGKGSSNILNVLLENGARTDQVSSDKGWTALMYAVDSGRKDILELLLIDEENPFAIFPLVETHQQRAGKSILNTEELTRQSTVNIASIVDGRTALIIAAEKNDTEMVRLLIKAKADVNAATLEGKRTSLMIAAERDYRGIVKMLIEAGADANITAKDCRTALMIAAENHHYDCAKMLIISGANVHISALDNSVLQRIAGDFIFYELFADNTNATRCKVFEDICFLDFTSQVTCLVWNMIINSEKSIPSDPLKVRSINTLIENSSSVYIVVSGSNSDAMNVSIHNNISEYFRMQLLRNHGACGKDLNINRCTCHLDITAIFPLTESELFPKYTKSKSSIVTDSLGNTATIRFLSERDMHLNIASVDIDNLNYHARYILLPLKRCENFIKYSLSKIFLVDLLKRFTHLFGIVCRYSENMHDSDLIKSRTFVALKSSQKYICSQELFEALIEAGFNFFIPKLNRKNLLLDDVESLFAERIRIYTQAFGISVQTKNFVNLMRIHEAYKEDRDTLEADIIRSFAEQTNILKLEPLSEVDIIQCPVCFLETVKTQKLELNSYCTKMMEIYEEIESLAGKHNYEINTRDLDRLVSYFMWRRTYVDGEYYDKINSEDQLWRVSFFTRITQDVYECKHKADKVLEVIVNIWKHIKGVIDSRGRNYLHLITFLTNFSKLTECINAFTSSSTEFVYLLCQKDYQGQTPLHYIVQRCKAAELEKILQRLPVDSVKEVINIQDRFGRTAIHLAEIGGNIELAKLLKRFGANTYLKDTYGRTSYNYKRESRVMCRRMDERYIKIQSLARHITDSFIVIKKLNSNIEIKILNFDTYSTQIYNWITSEPQFAYQDYQSYHIDKQLYAFMNRLKTELAKDKRFNCHVYLVGSGYEGTRAGFVDEFDYNMILVEFSKICEACVCPACPAGYVSIRKCIHVDLDDEYSEFFDENHFLKTGEIKKEFERRVMEIFKGKEFWNNENFFEMSIVHDDQLYKSATKKCNIKITINVINPVYKTISIDIVPALHLSGFWPLSGVGLHHFSKQLKDTSCNLVYEDPYHLHPWLPERRSYARISFSLAESEIIKNLPETAKTAYVISKYVNESMLHEKLLDGTIQDIGLVIASSHTLKTLLMYVILAEARSKVRRIAVKSFSSERSQEIGQSSKESAMQATDECRPFRSLELTTRLCKLLRAYLYFHQLDYLPGFFMPSAVKTMSDKELFIRQNSVYQALTCPAVKMLIDNYIQQHIIEKESVFVNSFTHDTRQPKSSKSTEKDKIFNNKSELYICVLASPKLYSIEEKFNYWPIPFESKHKHAHVVCEVHNGAYRLYKLSVEENCLIEYFSPDIFCSYMNEPRAFNWFSS